MTSDCSGVADISGIVLTKLDGTAKGGIIVSIRNELGIPVKLVGVGEKIDDLQPFHAQEEPEDVQYTLMMQSAMDVCAEERSAFKVWHGIAGAELLRTKFGVMDTASPDVLCYLAVRYHTIARAGMSDLEKIVYLADIFQISCGTGLSGLDNWRPWRKKAAGKFG